MLSAGVFLCAVLSACQAFGAEYGRVSGTVTDTAGNPIMGASVLLAGPGIDNSKALLEGSIGRSFTDAQGKFAINRVVPGWYSLQVLSPAKLPVLRNRIQVKPGTTTRETFALGDILSGIRWSKPTNDFRAWGQEWKWILRTSASTRPVLRYRKADRERQAAAEHMALPAQRVVAMIPGTAGANGLSEDSGTGTVVAYLHPLDTNSDLLVAGSVTRSNMDGSSIVTDYRRGFLKRDHEEISLAVHQLSMDGNLPFAGSNGREIPLSRGMVLRYVQTRQLSDALTLTAGFEMKYLNSASDVSTTQPEVSLDYQIDPSTVLSLNYGAAGMDRNGTLLQRVGDLNAFPRITLQNFRPRLERARHAELRLKRNFGAGSRVEFAAYHDAFQDVAVWGLGGIQDLNDSLPAGNVLISSAGNRAALNAGQYGSSGGEVAYEQQLGRHGEVGVMYAFGSALAVDNTSAGAGLEIPARAASLPDSLRAEFSQSVSGRVSTFVPGLKTQLISSYSWLPSGRITLVDPYGQSRMEFEPFWGLQVRQPLPKIDMLPLRIVVIADFRNLLGQGSVMMRQANGRSVLLTPAYRTIRGGFAVQF